jgi:endonuclease/exonuclease/phosphatase family metal-dependent hydrolase
LPLLSAGLLGTLLLLPGGNRADNHWPIETRELVPVPPAPPAVLRVVSYNVHSGRELARLTEAFEKHARLRAPDVLLVQEIESHPSESASRARRLAEALQMNYVYAPARATLDGGTHGLAVFSRFPLSDIEVLPLKQYELHYNTRRRIALGATVTVGGHALRLYNLHLDTRLNARERLEQLRPVVEAARAQPVPAVVVGGDFNTNSFRWLFHVVPVFPSAQAGAVDALMREKGFDAPLAAAGATTRKAMLPLRLDSLYTRGVAVRAAGVERAADASDHAPLWMEIPWPPARPAPE